MATLLWVMRRTEEPSGLGGLSSNLLSFRRIERFQEPRASLKMRGIESARFIRRGPKRRPNMVHASRHASLTDLTRSIGRLPIRQKSSLRNRFRLDPIDCCAPFVTPSPVRIRSRGDEHQKFTDLCYHPAPTRTPRDAQGL